MARPGIQRIRRALGAAIVAWLLIAPGTLRAADNVWRTSYDAALNEAIAAKRPLLIHFYGQHCPPCRMMERDVLHQPEVLALLKDRYVAVKIDAGSAGNADAARLVPRFGVHGLPCDVILDPISGKVLSQTEGFQDLSRYQTAAVRSRSRFDQLNQTVIVEQSKPKDSDPFAEANPESPREVVLGDPKPLLGLDGFSPVSLNLHREWTLGKPEHAWEFKGLTYYLADEVELNLFRKHPERYAPRLLGCDPVALWETDRAVPGDTAFGAYFDGELYLFHSEASRKKFKANPPQFTRIQHVLKVDQIQRVVTLDRGTVQR
ncbi:MAG: thioredoxin family protein [Planctomycetaceae bacterium]|nr:thioredoxin family protein [Planctomycetaceae bacterium]